MAVAVVMPSAGNSVESCIISKWHKKKGDVVKKGDVLFEYETDKASFEEEATEEGILLEIFFDEDDDVPVLTNVCVIGEDGESVQEFKPSSSDEEEKILEDNIEVKEDKRDVINKKEKSVDDLETNEEEIKELRISPRAKNKAEKLGVDHRYANPTGPYGRIIERDIDKLYESGPVVTMAGKEQYLNSDAESVLGTGLGGRITVEDLNVKQTDTLKSMEADVQSEYEDIKLSNIRKVIAKAMHQSLSTTAQLTLNTSFDASELLVYRSKIKSAMEAMQISNITLNDMIIYAVSKVLLEFKELNSHFLDDKIRKFNNVNMGIAVDTPRGLLVPTILRANRKSLNEISIEVKELAAQCKSGNISPDKLKDGSFTITNLGSLGIESFTPVLNPPQTAILGVCNIVDKCRKNSDGVLDMYPSMGLSLTFDHRAVDGAPAARFLKELTNSLENFTTMLVK